MGSGWDSLAQYILPVKRGHPILLKLFTRIIEKIGDITYHLDEIRDFYKLDRRLDGNFNLYRDLCFMSKSTFFDILVFSVSPFGRGVGLRYKYICPGRSEHMHYLYFSEVDSSARVCFGIESLIGELPSPRLSLWNALVATAYIGNLCE